MKPSYIRVVIDRAIHRELDYSVPETLAGRVDVGSRVRVPFRDKSALATVVATLEQREMDERLLLLPARNRYAQFAAASDSQSGDWLEETIVRATRAQD